MRNTETAMFIKSDCEETEFIDQARSFDTYQDAVTFCKKHRLKGVELVVRTASSKDDFIVSISGAPAVPAS